MKEQYAILRFAKYKGSTVSRIEAHNERTKETYASNPDIKTELSKHNFQPDHPGSGMPGPEGQCDRRRSIDYRQSGIF